MITCDHYMGLLFSVFCRDDALFYPALGDTTFLPVSISSRNLVSRLSLLCLRFVLSIRTTPSAIFFVPVFLFACCFSFFVLPAFVCGQSLSLHHPVVCLYIFFSRLFFLLLFSFFFGIIMMDYLSFFLIVITLFLTARPFRCTSPTVILSRQ